MSRSLSRFNPKGLTMMGNTIGQISKGAPEGMGLCVCNSGDYPLETRPELLALAMRIISAWSILDSYITRSFAHMVGDEGKAAIAMYESLGSTRTRHTTLKAAAKVSLTPVHYAILETLLWMYNKRVSFRNRVAHHLWGYSSAAKDGIVLMSPNEYVELETQDIKDRDWTKITVFERDDFEKTLTKAEELGAWFHDFYFLVIDHVGAVEILQTLLSEPRLQSSLTRFLPKDQNSPSTQQQ